MDPLIRLALYALLWPLSIVLVLVFFSWYRNEYPRPADPAPPYENPISQHLLAQALESYRSLPQAEQIALRKAFGKQIIPLDDWLPDFPDEASSVVCIGEYHRPSTRLFLAHKLIPAFPADTLLLEGTHAEVSRILQRMDRGREYFPLLGADITAVVRAARQANPDVRILGIEETETQFDSREHNSGFRDRSIADNAIKALPSRGHTLILYGAMHCTDRPDRLHGLLLERLPRGRLLNIQVLGIQQDGSLQAFAAFLNEAGMQYGSFVIPDTRELDTRVRSWFSLLDRQVFSQYRVLVAFRIPE